MMLLIGLFMVLLGLLLVPVNLEMLPFSGSAQLGLLMVLFAIQMLVSGNTPVGPFQRSWLIIALGVLFAVLGVVSCMIPGIMVPFLAILVGALNMAGGGIALGKYVVSYKDGSLRTGQLGSATSKKIFLAQLTMNLLSILFGASVFFSNFIPGVLIGVILVGNGMVLLYLLYFLMRLEKMKRQSPAAA